MASRAARVAAAAPGWSVKDVEAWLVTLRPSIDRRQLYAFRQHRIDGAALLELTSGELRADLGVTQLGVRSAILRGIAELKANAPSGAPPAEAVPPTAERAASEAARLEVQDELALARQMRDLALFDEAIAGLEKALELDSTNDLAQDDLETARSEKGVVEAIDVDIGSKIDVVTEHRIFRTVDGTGNNLQHPRFGRANEPLRRVSPPAYADGKLAPATRAPARGLLEATPRRISNLICKGDSAPSRDGLSAYVWAWGQFLDHELDLTESPEHDKERLSVETPTAQDERQFDTGETFHAHTIPFTRSRFTLDAEGIAQQTNQITSFIDASNVYGSDTQRALALRTLDGTGMLKTTQAENGEDLLPLNASGIQPNATGDPRARASSFFLTGDPRANENIMLISLHTLFVREHNFWCRYAAAASPELNSDELLFQHARRMVCGIMQSITFNEFLPALLGKDSKSSYRGYDSTVDASISTEFATAGYRFGHSMVGSRVRTGTDDAGVALRDAFFTPDYVKQHGADDVLLGACHDAMHEVDGFVVEDLRSFLFGPPGVPHGMMHDLPALNIQRGRDHGLAGYKTMRESFGLLAVSNDSFDSIPTTPERRQALARLYDKPDDIDPWVGALVEAHAPGAAVGPLIKAIMEEQFDRLRHGDRFWFENDNALSNEEKTALKNTTLADVLRRNATGDFPDDVFHVPAVEPSPVFVHSAGALGGGNDVHKGAYTIEQAKAKCVELGAVGFTHHGAGIPQETERVVCYFKSVTVGNDDPAWQKYILAETPEVAPEKVVHVFEFTDTSGNLIRFVGDRDDSGQISGPLRFLVPARGINAPVYFGRSGRRFSDGKKRRSRYSGEMGIQDYRYYQYWREGFLFEFTDTAGITVRLGGPGQDKHGRRRTISVWVEGRSGILKWGGFDARSGEYKITQGRRGVVASGSVPEDARKALRAHERRRYYK